MLIIEGPDGSGKTTLVQKIRQELGWPVMPRVVGKDTQSLIPSLKTWVDDNLRMGFHEAIYDRHRLISEPIYGPIFRDGLVDGFNDATWFSQRWNIFTSLRPFIIFCLPPLATVMENLDGDDTNLVVFDRTPLVYWQYWSLYCRMAKNSRILRYDYTENYWTPSMLANLIRNS